MVDDPAFGQHMTAALDLLTRIEERVAESVADVKAQAADYEQLREELDPYRKLANVLVARHFGVYITDQQLSGIASYVTNGSLALTPKSKEALERAQQVAEGHDFFHWELEFPKVFFDRRSRSGDARPGFTVIIGNPPYISAMELDRSLGPYEKPYWKEKFLAAQGAYDIYILFIEQCLCLVHTRGTVGLITPNKYLAAPYAIGLRKLLIDKHSIWKLRDLSRIKVFEDVAIYPVISFLKEGKHTDACELEVEQVFSETVRFFRHKAQTLRQLPDVIWGFLLTEGASVLRDIVHISNILGSVAQVNASTTAAEAESYGRYLAEDGRLPKEDCLKVVNTGLIDRYATTWGLVPLTHQHSQYQLPVLSKRAPVVSQNRLEQYSKRKVIYAKMALRIEAFPDVDGGFASFNTNFAIESTSGYGALFIAALSNSFLLNWVYEQFFGALKMSGGYFQYQAPQLRTLPIRRIAFTTGPQERDQLRATGRALYDRCRKTRDYSDLVSFADQYLPRMSNGKPDIEHERSDVIHDLLADLAMQMITLNRQKQSEIIRFQQWLERATGLSVDAWANKTAVKQYWEHAWETIARILQRNLSRFLATPALRSRNEEVAVQPLLQVTKEQWEMSCAVLRPILDTIDETDRLIDQIVYRLYGLTETEIAIVERRS